MTFVTAWKRPARRRTHALPSPPSDTIAIVPDPTSAVEKTLAKVPIFSGLTESELSFLAQRTVPRTYSAGQSVFGEGEPCSGLYVVESGHVRIFKSSANGREQVLSLLTGRVVPWPNFRYSTVGIIPRL